MLGQCMACRGPSDVTISVPAGNRIAHYAACWDHLESVTNRMRDDYRKPRPVPVAPRNDAIDTTAENVAGELDR